MSKGYKKIEKYTEITSFDLFYKQIVFNIDDYRETIMKDYLQVRLVDKVILKALNYLKTII